MTQLLAPTLAVLAVVVGAAAVRSLLAPRRPPLATSHTELTSARPRCPTAGRSLAELTTAFRRRRRDAPPRAVADWCDELARRLRGGSSMRDALAATMPGDPRIAASTAPLRQAAERGATLPDAVRRCPPAGPHLRLTLVVIAAVAELGGAPAMALDRAAATMRARAADADERAVQTAQARMSGQVLTALPLGMLALLVGTDGDVRAAVVTPVGATCIAVGVLLNACGWWWIRALTRGSDR